MEILTTVSRMIKDSSDIPIKHGDLIVFETADNRSVIGRFVEITDRGSLKFESTISGNEFCVMPKSIVVSHHMKEEE